MVEGGGGGRSSGKKEGRRKRVRFRDRVRVSNLASVTSPKEKKGGREKEHHGYKEVTLSSQCLFCRRGSLVKPKVTNTRAPGEAEGGRGGEVGKRREGEKKGWGGPGGLPHAAKIFFPTDRVREKKPEGKKRRKRRGENGFIRSDASHPSPLSFHLIIALRKA